ncbi:ABC transporter ATP-binding protein [Polaribacter sp. BM10]|uniref:ABC transporter ATP-binding protein n=1 Tax=Polaribacter sp. BM10 TaxID=1529069 RepID=UPI00098ACCEF|nr:ABC transporter ATP-binding protein [Polaribacter sp. BM10]AQS93274.1 ABC transporter ATP-binding protein [Polaribacter sp. BM10]
MSKEVILKVENLSKQYRLGTLGTGTISHDLNRFLAKIRGKEDPYLKIGESNDRSSKGESEYVWALKDINFEVKKGEVLGIIGKNGAGKSTLLKILSKVTGPTTGSIKSNGRIASLLEVGTGFHPEMTGKENIFLNGAILGMTKKEIASKLDEIIAFSGCERYVDTPVKRYSSGMKVRLAFAVAAHLEPDILIVDEVLAVGDAEFQKKAIGKMQDISKEGGRTVLFVSHNMAAVKSLCTRAFVIYNGVIDFEGKVEDAINEYLKGGKANSFKENYDIRKGNGLVKIVKTEIYGENQNVSPQTAKPFHLEFYLENSKNSIETKDLRLDVKIDDQYGQRIGWLSNWLHKVENLEKPNSILFKLENLQLNVGRYYISTDMYYNNTRTDWLQNYTYFDVTEGDYYTNGKVIPIEEARILLDFNVSFK